MKKQNGITLIALVITIIVLLILAGISISSILGDDGLIAKARAAAEKTKQAQLDEHKQLEQAENNMNLMENGVMLRYDVVQNGPYAILRLYSLVQGSDTYGDYAIDILYGKTEMQKAEMLLKANNYYVELGEWEGEVCETIDDLITYYGSREDWDCYGVTTIEEIVEAYEYDNLTELMIDWWAVEPEGYDFEQEQVEKMFTIKMGETIIEENISTYYPYVEIPITASGTYEVTLESGGKSTTITATVKVESSETVFVVEDGVIAGLKDIYYEEVEYCGMFTKFSVIAIPSKINGQIVTEIDSFAFEGCDGIKKIIIPNTVTRIGEEAFGGCYDLIEVFIPKSVVIIESAICHACNDDLRFKCEVGEEQSSWSTTWNCQYLPSDFYPVIYNETK